MEKVAVPRPHVALCNRSRIEGVVRIMHHGRYHPPATLRLSSDDPDDTSGLGWSRADRRREENASAQILVFWAMGERLGWCGRCCHPPKKGDAVLFSSLSFACFLRACVLLLAWCWRKGCRPQACSSSCRLAPSSFLVLIFVNEEVGLLII